MKPKSSGLNFSGALFPLCSRIILPAIFFAITTWSPPSVNAADTTAPTTSVSPAQGTYSTPQNVAFACSDPMATGTAALMGGTIQGLPLNLGGTVTTYAGSAGLHAGTNGTGTEARFFGPNSITTDGTNLFVADSSVVRKIVIATGLVTTLSGSGGSSGITTDGINLYVADNTIIRKIVIATGEETTIAGSFINGSSDGTGSEASFNSTLAITTDGANLYVADSANHIIRRVVIATGGVTTIAGSAKQAGAIDGIGSVARFNFPDGIVTDGVNLYVSDANNSSIRKISIASGEVTTLAGRSAGFTSPNGITTDGSNLYVVDRDAATIWKIVIATGEATLLAGSAGDSGSTDGSALEARFKNPTGTTSDGTNLYVLDSGNYTVRKLAGAASNGIISGCAATYYCQGSGCTPKTRYTGAIPISTSQLVRFYSTDTSGNRESVQEVAYTVNLPVNGICGSANNQSFTIPPGTNLCLTGEESAVSATAPWTWSCAGTNGGTTAFCSATKQGDTVLPVTSASPSGGAYPGWVTVTLTANEPATIYYTTNGAEPTTSSTVYTGELFFSESTTLKFFAKDTAGNSEVVKSQFYEITPVVYGKCGSSAYQTFATAPTIDLCDYTTNPPTVTVISGQWRWTCTGNTGGNAACIAYMPGGAPIQGDCEGNGKVSIAEVQSAINMFLGINSVQGCVDWDAVGGVTISEVQKVINGFLGL